MEYIYKKDNEIFHGCGAALPKGAIKVTGWRGTPGDPWSWYEKGIRISDESLIDQGLRADQRGTYYDQDKQEHKITVLDKEPESSWTKEKWKHFTDVLNQNSGQWEEDLEKKLEYEKAILRNKRSGEFSIFDKYQLPLPWESLTQVQKNQYISWRNAWLTAPNSGEEPERPEWFQI